MDMASLFMDAETIRVNLEKFAKAGEVSMHQLSTGTPKEYTKVKLSNEKEMTWNTFLINASKYLFGTEYKSKENPHRTGEALDKLCEMVGVVHLNEKYFRNKEYILQDLKEYAKTSGLSMEEVSVSKSARHIKITLSNGVKMKWDTFLTNASRYLLGTELKNKENPHRTGEALDKLCEMVGVVRNKEKHLTKTYFDESNKDVIKKDLETFAKAGGVSIARLATSVQK